MSIKVVTDGGAHPNPGRMRIGVVLMDEDKVLKCIHRQLGRGTNNRAEVLAMIEGINQAYESGYLDVVAYTDSKLLLNHYNGSYRIKDQELRDLHRTLKSSIKKLNSFDIKWHGRESDTAKIADAASRGHTNV